MHMKYIIITSVFILSYFGSAVELFSSSFGDPLGNYNEVTTYYNPPGYVSYTYNYYNGINTGMKWQCVEFVNRYYLQIFGINIRIPGQDAIDYYPNANQRGLDAFPNGGVTSPQVGDILCLGGNKDGHVAIIREVNTTNIKVIHQNTGNVDPLYFTFPRNGNSISGSQLGPGYYVQGWLRKPASGTTINIIGNINAVAYPQSQGSFLIINGQQKNISFTLKNISTTGVTRSFKLYLTDGVNYWLVWEKENLSLNSNQSVTFSRSTDASLGSIVNSSPGWYQLLLKGGMGPISSISVNSATIACQTTGCNPQDIEIIANTPIYYNISVISSPSNAGTTSGGGSFTSGSSCTVVANANNGYAFSKWTENGVQVSTNASFTFNVTQNRTLVANFIQTGTCVTCPNYDYTITPTTSYATHSASINMYGCKMYRISVTNGRTYTFKTGCGDGATANFDTKLYLYNSSCSQLAYDDDGCSDNNRSKIEWLANYSGYVYLKVMGYSVYYGSYTLAHKYTAPVVNYTISTSSSPAAGGSTSGGGSFASGSSCTVVANVNAGYTFNNWTENGNHVSVYPNYTFTVDGNRNLVANFGQLFYTVSTSSSPTSGGTTSGGGSFASGSSCTVTASPNNGYSFTNWTVNGSPVSSSASYSFTVSSNRTLVANFAQIQYTVSTSSSPTSGGTTSGGGSFASGSSCTVTASPSNGYSFTNWTEYGNIISVTPSYTFTVSGSRFLVANFSPVQYTVSTSSSPANGGTISGAGSYAIGSLCSLVATANAGYIFDYWVDANGILVSNNPTYTFNVTQSQSLVGHFSLINQAVEISNGLIAFLPFTCGYNDASGNNNHGLASGTVQVSDGCASMDPVVGDYITISDNTSLNNLGSLSLSAKVYPESFDLGAWANSEMLVGKGYDNVTDGYAIMITRNSDGIYGNAASFDSVKFEFRFKSYIVETGFYPKDNWYTVCGVCDSNLISIYINGILVNRQNIIPGIAANSYPLYINHHTWGTSGQSSRFGGKIDEVRVYNRALNGKEVNALTLLAMGYSENGLIAFYPFQGNASDYSGNGNHGIVHGNTTLTEDRFGRSSSAYQFGGTTFDWIEVAHTPQLNLGRNFTISAWVYKDNGPYDYVLGKGRDIQCGSWLLGTASVSIDGFCGTNAINPIALSLDQWHMITGVLDSANGQLRFYHDGQLAHEVNAGPFNGNNTHPMAIGRHLTISPPSYTDTWSYPFNGVIDDIQIYNRCLTDKEVLHLYQSNPGLSGAISAIDTIFGADIVCSGESDVGYSIDPAINVSSYIWSLPAGATGTSTTNTITVHFGPNAISGNISVKGVNACGEGLPVTKAITVSNLPATPSAISGNGHICPGQNNIIYSIPVIPDATSYVWSLPPGAIGTSTTNVIVVSYGPNASSGNISVKGVNACGEGLPLSKAITINAIPATGTIINGATEVCQGQANETYIVPAISGATSYLWSLPPGASGNSTTNMIVVGYGPNSSSGNISVKGVNACGEGQSITKTITVHSLPAAVGAINGNQLVCQGQSGETYTVAPVADASSYVWSLPPGVSGTSTTNSITVSYGPNASSGIISVKAMNTCGEGSPASLPISVNPLPGSGGIITGNAQVFQGSSNMVYQHPQIPNATYYLWTYSGTGATINGNGSSSVTINFSQNATSGSLFVQGVNNCGSGAVSSSFLINVVPSQHAMLSLQSDSAIPGSITEIHVFASNLTNVSLFQFSIDFDETKLTHLNTSWWNSAVNMSDLTVITNSSSGTITFFYDGSPVTISNGLFFKLIFLYNGGNAMVNWSDNPANRLFINNDNDIVLCTYSDGIIYPLLLPPTITQHPASIDACEGDMISFSVTATGTTTLAYQWKKNGSNVTTGTGGNTSVYTIPAATVNNQGQYTCLISSSSGNVESNSASLVVHSPPALNVTSTPTALCQGSSAVLNVQGALSYAWSHSMGSGSSKTVSPIESTTYQVTGTDNQGCTNTASVTVQVNLAPNVSLGPDIMLLSGNSVTLTPIITGGSGQYGYLWQPSGNVTGSLTVIPVANTSYSIAVTDLQTGCTASDQLSINLITAGTGRIEGIVQYLNTAASAITSAKVLLCQGSILLDSVLTDNTGSFAFTSVPGGTFTIKAMVNKTSGGYNSNDALLIMKHFVNDPPLIGLKETAADVNGSGFVNASDALLVAKRFAQIILGFPVGEWVSEAPVVMMPIEGTTITQNIKVLCTGDVNGSFSSP